MPDPNPEPLALSYPLGTNALMSGRTVQLAASGGSPPYRFSVVGGAGTVSPSGSYSAGASAGPVSVRVTDARNDFTQVQFEVMPNDASYGQLWGLHNASDNDIDAPEAWSVRTDCSNTLVAVMDTGVDTNHPDLRDNLWRNPGEIAGNGVDDDGNGVVDDVHGANSAVATGAPLTGDVRDIQFHGTHVSGTIGAVGGNDLGVTGVCWRARILTVRPFLEYFDSETNRMEVGATNQALIWGVEYATLMNARIINASLGGAEASTNLRDAIARSGALFVAAAGNGGPDAIGDDNDNPATPQYPANYNLPNLISVAATNSSDALTSFSNFGVNTVHLAAPGLNILSTFPTYRTSHMDNPRRTLATGYESISGTSMATPMVTGVAALLLSHEPSLTPPQLRQRLLDSADVKSGTLSRINGARRLNAARALNPSHPR